MQKYAAKIHFNDVEMSKDQYLNLLGADSSDAKKLKGIKDEVIFRYGVIQVDDMIRDLQYWESLMVSSML